MSNADLQQNIVNELVRAAGLNSSNISVRVVGDIAVLKGFVTSYAEKTVAEEATRRVKGIDAIVDELVVCLEPKCAPDDEAIATETVGILQAHPTEAGEVVKAVVNHGWVRLEGNVASLATAHALEKAVRYVPGVAGVSNNLKTPTAALEAATL